MSEEVRTNEKQAFIRGIITGVAVMVVLGGVFMAGQRFGKGGSLALGGDNSGTNAPAGNQPTVNQPAPNAPEGDASQLQPVTNDDHIRGNTKAKITMIEFSDFECPFCARFHPTMQQALAEYKDKVRLVYRHFPLRSIHPQAQKAAEASECASAQGKFWEMHDKLFDLNSAGTLTLENMKKAAADIGLNTGTFNDCLDTGKMAQIVEQDYQDGLAAGVKGTPGTFINGQYIAGALPYEQIKSVIESLL